MNAADNKKILASKLVESAKGYTGNKPIQDREALVACLHAVIEFLNNENFPAGCILPLVNLEGEIGNIHTGRISSLFTQDLPQKKAGQPPRPMQVEAREATYFACIDFLKENGSMSRNDAATFVETCAKKYNKGLPGYTKGKEVTKKEEKKGLHPYLERRKKFMDGNSKEQSVKVRNDIYLFVLEALRQELNKGSDAKELVESMIKGFE
jgi:hypothetical protein